jgi:glycosyltransferase involved in cell wall biosynthesis
MGHPPPQRARAVATPLVSVVVPTFNSAATLPRAVASVARQTLRDWELIVVDDGSTDATRTVLEVWAQRLGERLRRVRTANRGPGAARNTGIDLARGRYVAFLDADDEFLPEKLARQVKLFEAEPALGLVFCDYAFVDTRGVRHASVFDELIPFVREIPSHAAGYAGHVCAPAVRDWMTGRYLVSTITGVVRRAVLGDDVRFPPALRYCEEWLFFLEVCRRTRVGYIDAPLALHHHTRGSVSRTSVMRNLEHRIRALNTVRRRAFEASPRARRALRDQLAESHRQLGCDHYKTGAFDAAARHFAAAWRLRPDVRSAVHWAQATTRRVARRGRDTPMRSQSLT